MQQSQKCVLFATGMHKYHTYLVLHKCHTPSRVCTYAHTHTPTRTYTHAHTWAHTPGRTHTRVSYNPQNKKISDPTNKNKKDSFKINSL